MPAAAAAACVAELRSLGYEAAAVVGEVLEVRKRERESREEEAKVHTSMEGHPHATRKIEAACPLGEEGKDATISPVGDVDGVTPAPLKSALQS